MARITAPTPGFNDSISTVRFTDSVAITDDIAVIGYCQGAGYVVEYDDAPAAEFPEGEVSPEWTVAQLKAWAKAHDCDLGEATKKADIFDAITNPANPKTVEPVDPSTEQTPPES